MALILPGASVWIKRQAQQFIKIVSWKPSLFRYWYKWDSVTANIHAHYCAYVCVWLWDRFIFVSRCVKIVTVKLKNLHFLLWCGGTCCTRCVFYHLVLFSLMDFLLIVHLSYNLSIKPCDSFSVRATLFVRFHYRAAFCSARHGKIYCWIVADKKVHYIKQHGFTVVLLGILI